MKKEWNKESIKAVKFFGSLYAMAKALGIKPNGIYQWQKIPELRAYQIESLSKGKISAKRIIAE